MSTSLPGDAERTAGTPTLARAGALAGNDASDAGVSANPQLNPNFDYRWDPAGRRFRLTGAGIFTVTFAFALTF